MSPLIKFIVHRLLFAVISFLLITAILYAGIMLTPPETRATLYLPKRMSSRMTETQYQNLINVIIERHRFDAPYPIQYISWLGSMLQGTWGYSPTLQEDVLESLLRRTPATVELTLYSALLYFPLGIFTGVVAAVRARHRRDAVLQLSAFIATSMPTFILGLVLLSIFYAGLQWFPPERVSMATGFLLKEETYVQYTGLLTLDGLLNGKPEITIDAFRHLVLPVITLSLFHWATLHRITRTAMMDEFGVEYVLAAKARGIPNRQVIWRHALKNALSPILTSTMLSAASLLTSIYVVEIIYDFNGVSEVISRGARAIPDAPAAVGFAVYSIAVVLALMFSLDFIQSWLDPRYREGVMEL